jgi:hypothetical protein
VFHGKRHPAEMGAVEVTQFLSSLAVQDHVAASTQNQALSALLFLYHQVLQVEMPWLDNVVRAKRSERLPVVLTREEVRAVIRELRGPPRFMASCASGTGYPRSVYPGGGPQATVIKARSQQANPTRRRWSLAGASPSGRAPSQLQRCSSD